MGSIAATVFEYPRMQQVIGVSRDLLHAGYGPGGMG